MQREAISYRENLRAQLQDGRAAHIPKCNDEGSEAQSFVLARF